MSANEIKSQLGSGPRNGPPRQPFTTQGSPPAPRITTSDDPEQARAKSGLLDHSAKDDDSGCPEQCRGSRERSTRLNRGRRTATGPDLSADSEAWSTWR